MRFFKGFNVPADEQWHDFDGLQIKVYGGAVLAFRADCTNCGNQQKLSTRSAEKLLDSDEPPYCDQCLGDRQMLARKEEFERVYSEVKDQHDALELRLAGALEIPAENLLATYFPDGVIRTGSVREAYRIGHALNQPFERDESGAGFRFKPPQCDLSLSACFFEQPDQSVDWVPRDRSWSGSLLLAWTSLNKARKKLEAAEKRRNST